jgi:hypothetical protein
MRYLFTAIFLLSCTTSANAQKVDNIPAQRSLSIGAPIGPVETLLFCHSNFVAPPKAVKLTYRQLGSKITEVPSSNNLFYIPKTIDRKNESLEMCQTPPLKLKPAQYKWVDGLIEGERSALQYIPAEYGYVSVKKIFERGPVRYSPSPDVHLECYQVIELDVPYPMILTPAKTSETRESLLQQNGKTLQMVSPPSVESGAPEDGCVSSTWDYPFERRAGDGGVSQYLQTPTTP